MKRVAIFGNAGGGKSRLALRLAELTGLPLYVIDKMRFPGGAPIPHEDYLKAHAAMQREDEWIADGFESTALAWQRFAAADTLIHVDLPLVTHGWLVSKRFIGGLFADPPGWPQGSPLWASTLSSYRVLWPCHTKLTPKYRALIAETAGQKRVHSLKSPRAMRAFLTAVERETRDRPRAA